MPDDGSNVARDSAVKLSRVVYACPQNLAADSIVRLLELHRDRQAGPISKIIKNLCSFSCCDPLTTPCLQVTNRTALALSASAVEELISFIRSSTIGLSFQHIRILY